MRALLQRVSRARVLVDGTAIGAIGAGLVVFLGVHGKDHQKQAQVLAEKIPHLRVFDDQHGRMNLSLADTGGGVMVVSQFTLFADCRKGRRPSFSQAATPEQALELYEYFIGLLRAQGITVATGRFQATMEVDLVNDGPVTLLLDTDHLQG